MIAQRFRPVGWVAGVALAATALYLVSLQVASERGRLEEIDRKIAATKREIRQLQTEMGTRASLRQLERWNGEVLALSAPQAGQYLSGEAALDTLNRDELGSRPSAPPPVMVAAIRVDAAKRVENATPSTLLAALTTPKAPPKLTAQDRTVQAAIAPKSAPRPVRADLALVDRDALTRLASSETDVRRAEGKNKP
jgi:hypothetical protein